MKFTYEKYVHFKMLMVYVSGKRFSYFEFNLFSFVNAKMYVRSKVPKNLSGYLLYTFNLPSVVHDLEIT
jgi:hypothetical protein